MTRVVIVMAPNSTSHPRKLLLPMSVFFKTLVFLLLCCSFQAFTFVQSFLPPPSTTIGANRKRIPLRRHQQQPLQSVPWLTTNPPRPCCCFRGKWRLESQRLPDNNERIETDNTISNNGSRDEFFQGSRNTAALIAGQSVLIGAAIGASALLGTPNFGLGPAIDFSSSAFVVGALYVAPLVLLAVALDWVEEQVPALKDVTKATQRSVLALMGGRFKPLFAIMVSVVLGTIAGFGEEMLFRGVFQYEVASQFGIVAGVAISSLVFGLLHAVTPLYAVLATLASIYFGSIYVLTENLAIAITCHAVYDIGALFYAHWTVSKLSLAELQELAFWRGPETDA